MIPLKMIKKSKELSFPQFSGGNPWNDLMQYYVHILASRKKGALYIGVTSDLARRIYEHKYDFVEGFTKQYKVHSLV